jgi:hypothetical protein
MYNAFFFLWGALATQTAARGAPASLGAERAAAGVRRGAAVDGAV